MKKRIREYKKRNEYFDIKKHSIKINIIKITITKIDYFALLIINFLIIINFHNQTKRNNFDLKLSKIFLKIKGEGEIAILGNLSPYKFKGKKYLKEVFINGEKQNSIEYKYIFNQTDNFVELIWNDSLVTCKNMFSTCNKITEIDFSLFNTSKIKNMEKMFYSCSSLISLDLSNFDTSQVINMFDMFSFCSSLSLLFLYNLNTSQVTDMNSMFFLCSSLTSLDLSNFDTSQVIDMNMMFFRCSSLTSLDLSNFDTSKVTDMNMMFFHCSSLSHYLH